MKKETTFLTRLKLAMKECALFLIIGIVFLFFGSLISLFAGQTMTLGCERVRGGQDGAATPDRPSHL